MRAGTYRFRADRLIAHQNPYGTVVDYESKGPLAIIPAWPLEWSTPAPAGGLPFPGAESDPTGNDVAAGPILAELRRQDAQLDQDLAAGACVAEFHLLFNATRTTVDLPTGPVVTEVIHAGWLVVQTATGHVRRNFEVRVPPIGDRTVTSTGSQPTTASPCAGLPAPATPVDDAYSWATRFGVEEAESLWYLADGRRNETRGAQVYQFQGRDGAQVLVDAHRGWLVEAKGLTDAQLQAIVQA